MPQDDDVLEILNVGDEVQWKRRDLSKMDVDCLLHNIEDNGLIGPFRIIMVEDYPPTSCPKPNEKLVTIKDINTGKEKRFGSYWFEKYSG